MTMEHKKFPVFVTKTDAKGIVEAIVAVMGNTDLGDDVIHGGAFAKTIIERRGKIKVLDQHRTDSIMRSIGKCVEARELKRQELPPELLQRFPDATGGLYTKTQFLMNTPEGEGAFKRVESKAIDEWSIGYDALDFDYTKVKRGNKTVTVRNLRTLRLYEYSPVLFGMNEATSTLSAKDRSEEKPWNVFKVGDKWHVYKVDEEGARTGESLGAHDTEAEARAQVTALYSNADKDEKAVNLSELVSKISNSFQEQYNAPNSPMDNWVRDVYDEYVIVCCYAMRGPAEYFQVAYTMTLDGDAQFAPRAEWIAGEYVFVPLASEAEASGTEMSVASAKAGRVLAARNAERMKRMTALMKEINTVVSDIMKDAGMMEGEEDNAPEEDAKSEAGSSAKSTPVTSPTESARDVQSILRDIEIELGTLPI